MTLSEHTQSPIYGPLYGIVGRLYDKSPYALLLTWFGNSPLIAELYQLTFVIGGVFGVLMGLGGRVMSIVAVYRLVDILLNAIWWSFVKAPAPVLNAKRSLAMFLVNLAEIVLWHAVMVLAVGCAPRLTLEERVAALASLLSAIQRGEG